MLGGLVVYNATADKSSIYADDDYDIDYGATHRLR